MSCPGGTFLASLPFPDPGLLVIPLKWLYRRANFAKALDLGIFVLVCSLVDCCDPGSILKCPQRPHRGKIGDSARRAHRIVVLIGSLRTPRTTAFASVPTLPLRIGDHARIYSLFLKCLGLARFRSSLPFSPIPRTLFSATEYPQSLVSSLEHGKDFPRSPSRPHHCS